jgi:phage-related minor tail protein
MPKEGGESMAAEIARSLEEIDNKVKALNKTLKASGDETRELDKALKLDPKNIEAASKKMTALQTAVGTATQKVALLRQKQDAQFTAFAGFIGYVETTEPLRLYYSTTEAKATA